MRIDNIFKYALASLIVIGFFTLLIVLVSTVVPQGNEQLLNMAIGALIAGFSMIVGYFFGSSLGSQRKTELLNENNNQNLPLG